VPTTVNTATLSVNPNSAAPSPRPFHSSNGLSTSMPASPVSTATEAGFRPRASKIFNTIELDSLHSAPTPSERGLRKRTTRIVQ
jgi:hypothetical protein